MRPEEYLRIIGRRWWLLLLTIVVAAGVAYAYSSTQDETYQATARIMAIAEPPDYWLDEYARNRLPSYRDQIGSYDFVAGALEDAGHGIDTGHAMSALSLTHVRESNVVELIATDTDPERAALIVDALAGAFVEQSRARNEALIEEYSADVPPPFAGTVQIVKLDTPSPPETPIGPRTRLNTAAAAVLGLAFGIVLTFGVAYFEDVLRRPEDVERYLDLPTIATIPRH